VGASLAQSTNPDASTFTGLRRASLTAARRVYITQAAKDNPHNPPEYLDILGSITGVMGMRLAKGMWVQAEGVVYDTWS
jgi:hypothetical protein